SESYGGIPENGTRRVRHCSHDGTSIDLSLERNKTERHDGYQNHQYSGRTSRCNESVHQLSPNFRRLCRQALGGCSTHCANPVAGSHSINNLALNPWRLNG